MLFIGCGKRREESQTALQKDESSYVLSILLDMSGSFQHLMAEEGKAYEFTLQVIDRYFRDRIGMDDSLIIAQISGTDRALLWQGTPLQLRRDFPSASAFRNFLLSKNANSGSNVHQAVTKTVEYVSSNPALSNPNARGAVFVLSDMLDNHPDADKSKQEAIDAISRFGQQGGTVALYYVDQNLVADWRKHLSSAGVRHCCVEADFVSRPVLPSFE